MASGLDTAAATNTTKSPSYTISAGSNRVLVACAALEGDTVTSAPTYGGQTLTLVDNHSTAGGLEIYVYILLESGIAAASGTTLDWSGGVSGFDYSFSHRSYQGVLQQVPTNFLSGGSTSSTPNPLTSIDLTLNSGSLIVAFSGSGNGSGVSENASWANVTEQTDQADASVTGSMADGTSGSPRCTWAQQNRRADINVELNAASSPIAGVALFAFSNSIAAVPTLFGSCGIAFSNSSLATKTPASKSIPTAQVLVPFRAEFTQKEWDEFLRLLWQQINNINQGKTANSSTVTLEVGTTTTTVDHPGFDSAMSVLLCPLTANAAAEIGAGTVFISSRITDQFTLTHANNSQSDRNFVYMVCG